MKKLLFLILIISQFSFGQDIEKKTFKMTLVKPTNAHIEKSLEQYTDSIELTYRNQYFSYKKRLKETISTEARFYPEDMKVDLEEIKKNAELELKHLDSIESKILDYKYYELLSYYSTSILNMVFNEYKPFSEIYEIENDDIEGKNFADYSKENSVDFIVTFEDIKVDKEDNKYKMRTKLKLYSSKEKKIILEKEIFGNTNSNGGMWTCSNPLSCLFITSVKNTLEELIPEIKSYL